MGCCWSGSSWLRTKAIHDVGSGTEAGRSFTSGLISYIENHQNGDYLDGGTLEEKREVIADYVHRIEAAPATEQVRTSLYPSALSSKIGVAGFEPTTS